MQELPLRDLVPATRPVQDQELVFDQDGFSNDGAQTSGLLRLAEASLRSFLWQGKPEAATAICLLSRIEIQIGNGNLRHHSLLKNPKCLSDDRVILNFHTTAVTKHENGRVSLLRCGLRLRHRL